MTTWWWWGEPRASSTVRWLFLVRGTTSALDWWCSPFSCRATQSVPSLRASLPFYRATDVSSRCLAPFNPGDSFVILCGACLWRCSAACDFVVANVRWFADFTWRWCLHERPRGANRLGVSRSAAVYGLYVPVPVVICLLELCVYVSWWWVRVISFVISRHHFAAATLFEWFVCCEFILFPIWFSMYVMNSW